MDKNIYIICSVDVIIPFWTYMLVALYLQPAAKEVYVSNTADLYKHLFFKNISTIEPEEFRDQRVVIKGCGEIPVEAFAYAEVTKLLIPVAKSIMYGEPCSTVPIYKNK